MTAFRRLLMIGLLSAHAILLGAGAVSHAPVIDEIAHLAAGVSHWELNRFDLYKVNPPLARMLAAPPAIAAGAKSDYGRFAQGAGTRAEFDVMDDIARVNGPRVIRLVTVARYALIPLSLLGGYVCYRWARELYGHAAGIVALSLWCFCPNVLAYAQIVNADAAAAALGVTAGYCFWKWLRGPDWSRALLAGIALGLAELTKTTWLVLFALWPLVWLVVRCAPRVACYSTAGIARDGPPTAGALPGLSSRGLRGAVVQQLAQLAAILGLAVFLINAGYDFEGSGTAFQDYHFLSRPLAGAGDRHGGHFGNRFAQGRLAKLPLPLPRNYVEGIDLQWHDFELGKPSYLRGRWQDCGWWYWYLYALAVKVPLGTWVLFVLAVGARAAPVVHGVSARFSARQWFHRKAKNAFNSQQPGSLPTQAGDSLARCVDASRSWGANWRDEMVLLAPAVVVLALVSSQTGFSRYMRYALPMFPFVFVWISSVARLIDARRFSAVGRWLAASTTRLAKGGRAARESGDESPRPEKAGCGLGSMTVGATIVVALVWSIASSLWYAPHWMSYFNELADGPLGGPAHLIDAQVDWGQDLLYLRKWLATHRQARPIGLVYFGPINPALAGVDFYLPPKGALNGQDLTEIAAAPTDLKPGWYAVSVNFLHGYPHYVHEPQGGREWALRPYYSYFRRFRPIASAGYSIYIYHLTARDIEVATFARRDGDGSP